MFRPGTDVVSRNLPNHGEAKQEVTHQVGVCVSGNLTKVVNEEAVLSLHCAKKFAGCFGQPSHYVVALSCRLSRPFCDNFTCEHIDNFAMLVVVNV